MAKIVFLLTFKRRCCVMVVKIKIMIMKKEKKYDVKRKIYFM